MIKKILLIISIVYSFAGCSNTKITEQKSNLTVGMVKKEVEKGVTTQTDIIQIFGSPNMVTKNRAGNEVWSYNKMSTDSSEKSNKFWLLLASSNSAVNSTSTSTFDFIITFDNQEVVKDYSLISSRY